MNIYLERKLESNAVAKHIIESYPTANILKIDNYKNLFDKSLSGKTEKSIVIASVNNALLDVPPEYGFEGEGFFFKNSLNCVYDCDYCYLKGAFKNDTQVLFVNYEDIQRQIQEKLHSLPVQKTPVWFYSSDYSDNLAFNNLTQFVENFVPFFETLPNAMMEIRTKSTNISSLLKFKNIRHTEIAFSLNPQEIVLKYEHKTPTLDMRIQSINKLIEAGWLVGIRFLPLLPIANYQEIYERFLDEVTKKIDFEKVHSVFLGGLMYTYEDYAKILKKNPYLDIFHTLERDNDGFMREKREVREFFYSLFQQKLNKKCHICLDS